MPRDLRGRVIAITGASSGIGASTALACGRAGMRVVLGARRADRLARVAEQVEAAGGRALAVTCDVDRDADVDGLIARAVEAFGGLDAAFANAGYGIDAPVMETSDAEARALFETNFYGTLRAIRAAVPALRQQRGGGHLLICSSAASEVGPPRYGLYAATKAAQDAVASALRAELAGERVFVTTVHPIGTHTEFFARARDGSANDPTGKSDRGGGTPVSIRQSPEHVAACILRCMRQTRPAAEVWPSRITRLGVAFGTAFPGVVAWALRRHYRRSL